jgi:hypothetical protein
MKTFCLSSGAYGEKATTPNMSSYTVGIGDRTLYPDTPSIEKGFLEKDMAVDQASLHPTLHLLQK